MNKELIEISHAVNNTIRATPFRSTRQEIATFVFLFGFEMLRGMGQQETCKSLVNALTSPEVEDRPKLVFADIH